VSSKSQPSNPKDDAKSAPTASGTGSSSSSRRGGAEKEVESKAAADMEVVAPERGKSRGGTRGGKPNQATALDAGLGGSGMNSAMTVNLDSQIEKCDGTEATTQALLSEIIQRPKLTDKLLSKPPFRYLHDIITEVVKVTGFAKNLYTDLEMDSANVNEKNQKMDFLEKIIKVVGLQLNTLVAANPAKIVAGRDAQDTNNFLQLLAVAARHMPDSRNSVRIVMEQYGGMTAGAGGGNPPSEQPSMPAQKQQIATTATPIQQPISSTVPSAETKAKGHDSKESSREQSSRELIREQPPMTSREQPLMTSKETPRDPPSSMNDQMIADEKITVSDTLCLSVYLSLSLHTPTSLPYHTYTTVTEIIKHCPFYLILSTVLYCITDNCICIIIVYRE